MGAKKGASRRPRRWRWMGALVIFGGVGAAWTHAHVVHGATAQSGDVVLATETTLPTGTQTSENWGGYIDTPAGSQPYTSVTGSWTVPSLTGRDGAMAAQWIGLGGVQTQDLLQIGTLEQIENGQTQVQVFWEKLPAAANTVMTVPTGSQISASIRAESGSTWVLSLQALTPSGQTLSKSISVNLSNVYAENIGTSAEWISEDPSTMRGGLYPLADSSAVQFTNATVNGQPLNASSNEVQPVAMVDVNGDIRIAPSSIGSDGESFTTTTYAEASSQTWPGASGGWTTSTGTSTPFPGASGFPFPAGQNWSVGSGGGGLPSQTTWSISIPGDSSGWTQFVWPQGHHRWSIDIPMGNGTSIAVQLSWGW
ncbi:G1 family glutamic endopeptidase [Alicyclobacillus mali (ex Roth et al. 2021)]|uniref:G1 family glutamic endopeptidase n=1 Tax=Alicyclobacillus mali (ex Roth et al. 2021) TaxID=1123961 RepID=UPI000B332682|nr:G1 family glutamic endopeptidase [Alicyclobacillus mali (ex Roth et al. 2021)]